MKGQMNKTASQTLEAEVMEAYCDCHEENFEKTISRRNLRFKASEAMPRDEAAALMARAVPDGYNEFYADLIKLLPKDSMVTIARESSVCLYVTAPAVVMEIPKMEADEWGLQPDGSTRVWWD